MLRNACLMLLCLISLAACGGAPQTEEPLAAVPTRQLPTPRPRPSVTPIASGPTATPQPTAAEAPPTQEPALPTVTPAPAAAQAVSILYIPEADGYSLEATGTTLTSMSSGPFANGQFFRLSDATVALVDPERQRVHTLPIRSEVINVFWQPGGQLALLIDEQAIYLLDRTTGALELVAGGGQPGWGPAPQRLGAADQRTEVDWLSDGRFLLSLSGASEHHYPLFRGDPARKAFVQFSPAGRIVAGDLDSSIIVQHESRSGLVEWYITPFDPQPALVAEPAEGTLRDNFVLSPEGGRLAWMEWIAPEGWTPEMESLVTTQSPTLKAVMIIDLESGALIELTDTPSNSYRWASLHWSIAGDALQIDSNGQLFRLPLDGTPPTVIMEKLQTHSFPPYSFTPGPTTSDGARFYLGYTPGTSTTGIVKLSPNGGVEVICMSTTQSCMMVEEWYLSQNPRLRTVLTAGELLSVSGQALIVEDLPSGNVRWLTSLQQDGEPNPRIDGNGTGSVRVIVAEGRAALPSAIAWEQARAALPATLPVYRPNWLPERFSSHPGLIAATISPDGTSRYQITYRATNRELLTFTSAPVPAQDSSLYNPRPVQVGGSQGEISFDTVRWNEAGQQYTITIAGLEQGEDASFDLEQIIAALTPAP